MECPRCGKRIAENSLFCKYCAYQIPQKPKYVRSKAMKIAMSIVIAGLVVFAAGLCIAIYEPEIGLVPIVIGVALLVVGAIAYLCAEWVKIKKDREDLGFTTPTSLPKEPIAVRPNAGFIFSDMKQVLKYFSNAFTNGSSDGFVDVSYNNMLVLQIADCPNIQAGETHCIGVFFFPYLYEDEQLYARFMNNEYYPYFNNNPLDSDEGADAYFGSDIQLALQAASSILATVYNIPLNTKLKVNCTYI